MNRIFAKLRALFRKEKLDRDMAEEMRFHLAQRTADNVDDGMSRDEACYAAQRKFGGVEQIKERCRDVRGVRWLDDLARDFRYATRSWFRNPGFTVIIVLTLAFGIGANTALFTVINALLLRSLPVARPEQLVQIATRTESGQHRYAFSYPVYSQLRDGSAGELDVFAFGGVSRDRLLVTDSSGAEIEFVRTQPVTGNCFSALGLSAHLGRALTVSDDSADQPQAAVVVSHDFWERRFGGDPSVVGRAIVLNNVPFTIVGVTPRGFFGVQPGENPDLWWPLQMVRQIYPGKAAEQRLERDSWLRLMGRLAPTVVRSKVQAGLSVIFQRHLSDEAARRTTWTPDQRRAHFAQQLELRPGGAGWSGLRDRFRGLLFILTAIVSVVLLIACANVATLLLARAAARQREFAMRSALGAGRGRLIRQMLTESVLLAGLAGVIGLLFAQWGTRALLALMRITPDAVSFNLNPDARILLFTAAMSLLTGILFGLAPALQIGRQDLSSTMKRGAPSRSGLLRLRLDHALIVAQVALSIVLLIGAGVFLRTLHNLRTLDRGFRNENIVLFQLDFTQPIGATHAATLQKELRTRLETSPGVRSASVFDFGFLSGSGWSDNIFADGQALGPDEKLECAGVRAGPRFFETLGMTLLHGRVFAPSDERAADAGSDWRPRPAVINETMARRIFGESGAIGRQFWITGQPEQRFEIVGVVRDAKYGSLREKFRPTFYVPQAQGLNVTFAVRTEGDAGAIKAAIPALVRQIEPTLRARQPRTMDEIVDGSIHQERVLTQLGGFFSLTALGLAFLGLYGVISFSVLQRTRELGVRVALGAKQSDILSLVVGQGIRLAAMGTLLGLIAAWSVMRSISSLLYGVEATDPVSFVAVAVLIGLVAFFASWLPARRAAKVDPMVALRCE